MAGGAFKGFVAGLGGTALLTVVAAAVVGGRPEGPNGVVNAPQPTVAASIPEPVPGAQQPAGTGMTAAAPVAAAPERSAPGAAPSPQVAQADSPAVVLPAPPPSVSGVPAEAPAAAASSQTAGLALPGDAALPGRATLGGAPAAQSAPEALTVDGSPAAPSATTRIAAPEAAAAPTETAALPAADAPVASAGLAAAPSAPVAGETGPSLAETASGGAAPVTVRSGPDRTRPAEEDRRIAAIGTPVEALPPVGGIEAVSSRIGAPGTNLLLRPDAVPTRRPGLDAAGTEAVPQSPLEAFATPVEADTESPRMAVVLIHDGQGPVGPEALHGFPFPITVAVDPALPDAAQIMAAYRAEGIEVMALADLPAQTRGEDAVAAVQASLQRLPEVIGVLEGTQDGIHGSRAISDQIAALMRQSGLGLVVQKQGLNIVQQQAERAGVAAGTVFRDFDGAGQDGRAIRRFLDQAAFRARQDGGVIMLGRARPDTVSSLILWGLQDRAGLLQLVPVSNLLLHPPA
ncbi:MAG: divergent polysaccharide deacetylase family protein [Roseivivax sp.]|nr:divergent polysaccharide deacetylase family protein [Roseivivax sp.]